MEEVKDVSINEFIEYLENIKKEVPEFGNFKIKIGERYLKDDEVTIDFYNKEIRINHYLFYENYYKEADKFRNIVNRAFEEFSRNGG